MLSGMPPAAFIAGLQAKVDGGLGGGLGLAIATCRSAGPAIATTRASPRSIERAIRRAATRAPVMFGTVLVMATPAALAMPCDSALATPSSSPAPAVREAIRSLTRCARLADGRGEALPALEYLLHRQSLRNPSSDRTARLASLYPNADEALIAYRGVKESGGPEVAVRLLLGYARLNSAITAPRAEGDVKALFEVLARDEEAAREYEAYRARHRRRADGYAWAAGGLLAIGAIFAGNAAVWAGLGGTSLVESPSNGGLYMLIGAAQLGAGLTIGGFGGWLARESLRRTVPWVPPAREED